MDNQDFYINQAIALLFRFTFAMLWMGAAACLCATAFRWAASRVFDAFEDIERRIERRRERRRKIPPTCRVS